MSTRAPLLRLLAASLLAVVLAAPLSAQGRIDIVNARGEISTLSGATVLSETLAEVSFKREGSDRVETRKSDIVVAVHPGRGSDSYEQALERLQAGDLSNAANLFAAAANDSEPPWVAAHALLQLARTHARRGPEGVAPAREALAQLLQRFPDHRLLPEALLLQARLAGQAGSAADAGQAAAKLVELVSAQRVTADWGVRAHLEHGRAALAAGDARAAGEAFAAAERAVADARNALSATRADLLPVLDELLLAARVGVGDAMLARGDVGASREYWKRLAGDATGDEAVLAAALNGQAECDFREQKLKEAQLGFARVAVTAAGTPEQHAKALFFLGKCSEALALAGQEKNGRQRARDYFQDVVQRHPETSWAAQARQSLP